MPIPDGYTIKGKFPSRDFSSIVIRISTVLIAILFFFVSLRNFNWLGLISKYNFQTVQFILIGTLMLILVFYQLHGYIHEQIHQKTFQLFGLRAELHMKLFTGYVNLPIGDGCIRNQAIIVLLSPLVVLEGLGLVIWLLPTGNFLPLVICFLSINVVMAETDIATSLWLMRLPSNYYFGFDGQDSVSYG